MGEEFRKSGNRHWKKWKWNWEWKLNWKLDKVSMEIGKRRNEN